MKALYKLINKYFWKGGTGPMFCFLMPSILLIFLGLILDYGLVLPGAFTLPILTTGLIFMPQSIFEFKNSSILKRIGLANVNSSKFLFVLFTYNFLLIILGILFQFCITFIIFYDDLYSASVPFIPPVDGLAIERLNYLDTLRAVDWGGFTYSLIILISTTMVIGLCLSSFSNSSMIIVSTGISIVLITMFIGPATLPINMVGKVDEIKYIGYIWPLRYPLGTLIESFNGNLSGSISVSNLHDSSIWDVHTDYAIFDIFAPTGQTDKTIIYYNFLDKILNLAMPYVILIFFSVIAILKFSWSTRSTKKINWKKINIKELFSLNERKIEKNQSYKNSYLKGSEESPFIIEAHSISKNFGNSKNQFYANDKISISFKKGENVAILGGNGAGKTTFIEMLLGLNSPTSGYFRYNYKYQKKFSYYLGVQFQECSFPNGLKCKDIILFFIDIYKLHISDKELNKLIKDFGIEKFYNKYANSLSGGQKQRVNLLLAILHKPKVIFLDELSTGLDIEIRNNIKAFIKQYAKDNDILLIVISHDMNEVEYLCDRIIVFKKGKIASDSLKSDILKKNKNIEEFIAQYLK
ncbi:MAG: ATP-binding cassette domain-containing protein [Mycoplasmoidaceae bacterium]